MNRRQQRGVQVSESHLGQYRDEAIRLHVQPTVALSLIRHVVCVRLLLVQFLQQVQPSHRYSLNNLRRYGVRRYVDAAEVIDAHYQGHRQVAHQSDRAYALHW